MANYTMLISTAITVYLNCYYTSIWMAIIILNWMAIVIFILDSYYDTCVIGQLYHNVYFDGYYNVSLYAYYNVQFG